MLSSVRTLIIILLFLMLLLWLLTSGSVLHDVWQHIIIIIIDLLSQHIKQ